jgi:hypothetical protein
VIADAKDRSGESVDAAGDELEAEAAAASRGQVTAVDRAPDSDAITSDAVEGGTINGASTTASSRGSATTRAKRGDDAGS